jgi:hypothetical protein
MTESVIRRDLSTTKENELTRGWFRIALQANTYTQITASNIFDGTFPPSGITNTIFNIVGASSIHDFNARVYVESSNVYAWADKAQTYQVRWYTFN